MTLAPNQTELLARARADLRMGVPVVLRLDGRDVVAAAAETLSAGRLDGLRALGDAVLAITPRRAETLKARAIPIVWRGSSCRPMPIHAGSPRSQTRRMTCRTR